MKCPHCGRETKGKETCEHCGKSFAAGGEVEVSYKDFKVTELLDIKMPGRAAPPEPEGKTVGEGTAGAKRPVEKKAPPPGKPAGAKKSRLTLVAIALLLAAAAAFVLLKLLTKF